MKEGIDMIDSFDDVLKARRSTREYTEEGVSKEDMQQIVEAGTLAPSGMGKKRIDVCWIDERICKRIFVDCKE